MSEDGSISSTRIVTLLDALCCCRKFGSPFKAWTPVDPMFCENQVKTNMRWEIVVDNQSQQEEWIRKGLVFRVFRYIGNNIANLSIDSSRLRYLIAFRHQVGDTLFDNDQWEAMGQWGRNAVNLFSGNTIAQPDSFISFLAQIFQGMIRFSRKFFRIDYVTLSSQVLGEIAEDIQSQTNETISYEFTGYSMGGALAQLHAVRYNASAVLFASNGILDIMSAYNMTESEHAFSTMMNIFEENDLIPRMDCQTRMSTVCTFKITDVSKLPLSNDVHENLVFGNSAQLAITNFSVLHCRSGEEWNRESNAACLAYNPESQIWHYLWFVSLITFMITLEWTRRLRRDDKKKKIE